jgi:exopolysaccharide biosynthesis polyprenyl glycosylphosphotransferase
VRTIGLKARMVVVDTLTIVLALVLSFLVYPRVTGHTLDSVLPIIVISVPVWPVLFAQQGLFQARHLTRRIEELRRLVNAVLMGVVAMAGISVVLQVSLSRGWLLAAGVTVFVLVAVEREVTRQAVRRLRLQGRMSRKVVLVGDNSEAQELIDMLRENKELGYDVVGRISDQPVLEVADDDAVPYLGCTEEALELVRSVGASSVVVATTSISLDSANRLVRDLTREGIYVELSSAMRDIATRRVTLRPLGRYPVMCVEPVTSTWRSVSKRAFDIVVATIGLILVSPVLLAAALAIRVTSGPGVLFSQTRVGRNGAPFTVYKLRTMVPDAESLLPELMARNEAAGPMFKMADDPRVTPVGRRLRKTSIDELPQLLNVVTGDMSLVGPRPALPHEAVQWNDDLKERLRVKPGMTGNWQVNGRFTASLEDYQRLDLYYVDNWSLVTDLVILAKTVPAVLHRNGAA